MKLSSQKKESALEWRAEALNLLKKIQDQQTANLMLKELRIKNFAIIDNLNVEFTSGLTALTGETGAGKSMILDSLNLICGSRIKTGLRPEKGKITSIYYKTRHE